MLIFQRRRQGRESDLLSAGRGRCFACRSCVLTIGWLTTLFPNILPPPCLRYNLLNPKPTLITFGNNYNKMRILFPFTVALCTLTSARSMSIQFWLKFTVENKKKKWLENQVKPLAKRHFGRSRIITAKATPICQRDLCTIQDICTCTPCTIKRIPTF